MEERSEIAINCLLSQNTIFRLGEELAVQKRELSKTRGELSDVKLNNNQLLNIAQSATLDAYIATQTAENLVKKIVASVSDRVITSAQSQLFDLLGTQHFMHSPILEYFPAFTHSKLFLCTRKI